MSPSPPPADAEKSRDQSSVPQSPEPLTPVQLAEFSYELKIPKDRIAVLIGPKGATKKELMEETKVAIKVDSKEGDVILTGKDSLALFTLREVIRAIGRGFNPEIAHLLMKQDYVLEVITISEFAKTKNHLIRMRGRLIGADGKARVTIENLTGTYIVVYGKTVAVIGTTERAILAKRALESLLEGSPHANVYKWLERNQKRIHANEMAGF